MFDRQMVAGAGDDAPAVGCGAHRRGPLLAETPKACLNERNEVLQWILDG